MGELAWPDEMGSWIWDGESLIWPGGTPENMEQSWGAVEIETDNHEMPEVHGKLIREAFVVEKVVSVDFRLSGLWLPNGDPAPNVGWGIAANYAHLQDVIGSPLTWTGPGVTTTVERADGVTIGGTVQGSVGPLGERRGPVNFVTVTVTVPDGALFATGS